jgi:hypothetical protein
VLVGHIEGNLHNILKYGNEASESFLYQTVQCSSRLWVLISWFILLAWAAAREMAATALLEVIHYLFLLLGETVLVT